MKQQYQTLHNALFNTSSWVLSIVFNFVFLPYIVHQLGAEAYGVLVLVLSVIGYFALLDLDLGQAVTKYVAEFRAADNSRMLADVIGVALSLYLMLGLIGAICILGLTPLIVTGLFKVEPALVTAAKISLAFGSLGFFLTMLLSALAAIPNGLNRYDVSSKIAILMSFLTTSLTVVLLYLGFGLIAVVLLNVSLSALGVLCYRLIIARLLPGVRLWPSWNRNALGKVLKFGLYSSLSRISYIVQFQTDRLVTGAILGASWVTYYFVPFSIVQKAMTVTSRVSGVILPVVSGLQGSADAIAVNRLYVKASRLIVTMATAVCLPILLFGDDFLRLWMGPEFAQHSGRVLVLITMALYADAFTNVPSFVLQGLGLTKVTGTFAIANAIVNVALLYPLGKWLGLNGIALAFLISSAGVAPVFIVYANRKILHVSTLRLIADAYLYPVAAAVAVAVPCLLVRAQPPGSLLLVLALMAATSLIYLLLALLIGVFTREERDQMLGYLMVLAGRRERPAQ